MSKITRRRFLQSAGGVTFLALTPIGRGLFAAPDASLPRFTALPYLQPGPAGGLKDGAESLILAWQTENTPADFRLDYGPTDALGKTASLTRIVRTQGTTAAEGRVNYAASLSGLRLGSHYSYRLIGNGGKVVEGHFATRRKRGERTRFVAFGDNAYGDPGQRAVAFHAYQAHPDFIMNTGDNVYESGLDSEYVQYFYPIYNADRPDPAVGAPLLRSVPFYTVIANHDVHGKTADGLPAADFDAHPDALAYYTAMHLPQNGPATLLAPTPLAGGSPEALTQFRQCAGPRYPRQANYSFDCGDAHFLCLDSNTYIDPTDKALQEWITADLIGTDAHWKFVVCHHPPFNVGSNHYKEQQMRVLAPLFEKHGVDVCLHGHEHTYQRTRPLRFQPTDTSRAAPGHHGDRRIPGSFTIDTSFDGAAKTKPDGIIYITTGAGGKELYDPGFDDSPEKWLHADDNNVAYVARFVSAQHSLTVFDIDGPVLTLTQIGEDGKTLDHVRITKA